MDGALCGDGVWEGCAVLLFFRILVTISGGALFLISVVFLLSLLVKIDYAVHARWLLLIIWREKRIDELCS